MAPWWWFPCKPKTCWSSFLILKCFNNSTFFNVVCISWKLKWWIILMHGVTMKSIPVFSSVTCSTSLLNRLTGKLYKISEKNIEPQHVTSLNVRVCVSEWKREKPLICILELSDLNPGQGNEYPETVTGFPQYLQATRVFSIH